MPTQFHKSLDVPVNHYRYTKPLSIIIIGFLKFHYYFILFRRVFITFDNNRNQVPSSNPENEDPAMSDICAEVVR